MAKRRIMRAFKLNEISAVDAPAQAGARAVILKRDAEASAEDLVKRGKAVLTTATEGHTHLVMLENFDGVPMSSGQTSLQQRLDRPHEGHSHPWVMLEDGNVVIGEVDGHTHEPDVYSKAEFAAAMRKARGKDGFAMPDGSFPVRNETDLKNAIAAFEKAADKPAAAAHIKRRAEALDLAGQLPSDGELATHIAKSTADPSAPTNGDTTMADEDLKKQLEAANAKATQLSKSMAALLALGADGIDYVNKLGEQEREAFLGKSEDEQKAEIAKAQEAAKDQNPVVYTASDGTEYRKNDDQRLVSMAKQRDEDRKELEKQRRQNEDLEFAKRANAEFGKLAGEDRIKVAVLRAIEKGEKIEDEKDREAAIAMLKGANEAVKLSEQVRGHGYGGSADDDESPEAQLEKKAREYAEKHSLEFAQAYAKFIDTQEGRELYEKVVGGNGAATAH